MRYIIDTHTLLWSLYSSDQLSENVRFILTKYPCCVSIASFWEMSIKQSLGKLILKQSFQEIAKVCSDYEIEILGIMPIHCQIVSTLPFIHRDPFDRLIIVQAQAEDLIILTKDDNISRYDVKTLW